MFYTERFSEAAEYLGGIDPASYNSEQNTGYLNLENYHRCVILVHAGVLGGNVDIDIEQGTDSSGTGAKKVDSGGKDLALTATTDNNTVSVIEVKSEEMDVANSFNHINVECTPASAGIIGIQVWGIVSRYKPTPTTNLDSVTD